MHYNYFRSEKIYLSVILIVSVLIFPPYSSSQVYISDIFLERKPMFDTSGSRSFFASKFLNSLHTDTKPYIISDELLFSKGDKIEIDLIDETERNLRALDIFSNIRIEFDSTNYDTYDVYVVTSDRWSTFPIPLLGSGGGEYTIGGRLEEMNFLGMNYKLRLEALYRTENDIGWQGYFTFKKKRLFRTEYYLGLEMFANSIRTEHIVELSKPYRTLQTDFSYGVIGLNSFGNDFLYRVTDTNLTYKYKDKNAKIWFSRAWNKKDRVFATLYMEWSDANRGFYRRAYDNSGKILIAFSSVSQDFYRVGKVNGYAIEDLSVGGWGSAVLGKIFPIGSKGEAAYYAGGQGEQSFYTGDLYLFGRLSAGSGFLQDFGLYTYQEFYGLGYYRLNEEMLIAARFKQQTSWNWLAHRQLILDFETAIRGYDANSFAGDNRIIGNIEFRIFPDFQFGAIALGGALFYDVGTVWDQDTKIWKAQWHQSLGFGLRICDPNSTGKNSVFRLDFAFNFDKMRFGSIVFSSNQLFSAFSNHEYRIPEVFGMEFDRE